MADPPRLSEFGLRSYVSQAGLAGVLKLVRERGVPTATSRMSVKRSREQSTRVNTPYGPLIKSFTCKGEKVEYVCPAALLSHTCINCSGFSMFMGSRLEESPSDLSNKWGLIWYVDEVAPGNQLRHDNRRKIYAVYYSFLQFGAAALSCESCWMVLTVLRSSVVNRLGGMGDIFPHIMSCFFGQPDLRSGLLLQCTGTPRMLCACLQVVVADEAALKSVWENKGSGGHLPCLLCSNCVLSRWQLHTHDIHHHLIPITETDTTKFVKHNTASIQAIVHHLTAQRLVLGNPAFEKLEQSLGFNFRPEGVLWSDWFPHTVSPTENTMWDWMHTYFVHGIWNIEIGYLLKALSSIGVSHVTLNEFLQSVHWPHNISSRAVTGQTAFAKRSGTISSPLSCSASEALSVYSPIRLFLIINIMNLPDLPPAVVAACRSYLCLAEVIDHLRAVSHGKTTPAGLGAAIQEHFQACEFAYSDEHVTPKYHYATHLPEQYQRHGLLVNCFVHERKHRELKRFGNHLTNTSASFESTLLESTLLCQLAILDDESEFPSGHSLIKPLLAPTELADIVQSTSGIVGPVLYAREAVIRTSQRCHADDVILFEFNNDRRAGQVWYHTAVGDIGFTCVELWDSLGNNQFKPTLAPVLIPSTCILDTCIWSAVNDTYFICPATV